MRGLDKTCPRSIVTIAAMSVQNPSDAELASKRYIARKHASAMIGITTSEDVSAACPNPMRLVVHKQLLRNAKNLPTRRMVALNRVPKKRLHYRKFPLPQMKTWLNFALTHVLKKWFHYRKVLLSLRM